MTEKPNFMNIVNNYRNVCQNFLRFFPKFWQINTFGVVLASPAPQLLHHWVGGLRDFHLFWILHCFAQLEQSLGKVQHKSLYKSQINFKFTKTQSK